MRVRRLVFIVLLAFTAASLKEATERCGSVRTHVRNRRIINGVETAPHQFPWIVSIRVPLYGSEYHYCGGVLISAFYVLSAAHCFEGKDAVSRVVVLLGAHDWRSGQLSIDGTALIHNKYAYMSEYHGENDIAVIRLRRAAPFGDNIRPICLPSVEDRIETDDELVSIGWGSQDLPWTITEEVGPAEDEERYLHRLSYRVANASTCVKEILAYQEAVVAECKLGQLDDTFCSRTVPKEGEGDGEGGMPYNWDSSTRMICAVPPPESSQKEEASGEGAAEEDVVRRNARRATCYGDSGGPLMKQRKDGSWVVVGIVSMGAYGCIVYLESHPQTGDLFTDVFSKTAWINSSMQWLSDVYSASPPLRPVWHSGPVSLPLIIVVLSFIVNGKW